MESAAMARRGGMAAMLGGGLCVVKGVGLEVFDVDLSLVPLTLGLFALGLVGLHARLGRRPGRLGRVGLFLAVAALAAALVTLVNLAAVERDLTPAGPDDFPLLVEFAEAVAFLGVLLGLVVLGFAVWRASAATRWRAVPLAVGLLWFPAIGLTWFLGEGMVVPGLAWMGLGFAIWSGKTGVPGAPIPYRRISQAMRSQLSA